MIFGHRSVRSGRSPHTRRPRRAFTLTELLVVVIVLGVLSAVAVPKFTRVLESRKTTEAESVLSALRTEQEKRCALGKRYVTDWAPLASSVSPDASSYHFSLQGRGATAGSKGKDYRLKMLSYKDGSLCCEGAYCSSLNKDYPSCSSVSTPADECAASIPCSGSSSQSCGCQNKGTQNRTCESNTGTWGNWSSCSIGPCKSCSGPSTQSCGCNASGTQSRTCDPFTGSWSGWSGCSAGPCKSCSGSSSQSCGCNNTGTQHRTCNPYTGSWSGWSSCSAGPCKSCPSYNRPASAQSCGNCGSQSRSVTCNPYSGTWQTGGWSGCGGQGECQSGATQSQSCPAGYEGSQTRTCGSSCSWGAWDTGACRKKTECDAGAMEYGATCGNCGRQRRTCSAAGKWEAWVCVGQGECSPGQEGSCNSRVCQGTRVCNSSCSWGACQRKRTYGNYVDTYCTPDGRCVYCGPYAVWSDSLGRCTGYASNNPRCPDQPNGSMCNTSGVNSYMCLDGLCVLGSGWNGESFTGVSSYYCQ